MIRKLMLAGADAFRINMSHGDQKQKAKLVEAIRALEKEFHRPDDDPVRPAGPQAPRRPFRGRRSDAREGPDASSSTAIRRRATRTASSCPHPELFEAVKRRHQLLIDDGKLRLRVHRGATATGSRPRSRSAARSPTTRASTSPTCVVPIPALTEKDRADLAFALEQRADWIALVVRPAARGRRRGARADRRAAPRCSPRSRSRRRSTGSNDIVALADAVMVARGDLGVELPPEAVPPLQNKIVACARAFGKPVVVATQMLESMITLADADPRRGQRRRDRDLRRRRRGHAVGGKRRRRISGRGGGR